ncbi:MAG TPA: MlaD family protein [Anaeromyxobacter sp.]|nr:MlaD family protein [Anaeromyxobacter sp.]
MKPVVNRALAVGLLAAVTGVAFLVALTFFRKGGFSDRDSYIVYTYFRDATGLTWKSRVQIAGIQIGEVDEIRLEGARARLEIRVKKDVELHADACFTKVYPSALLPDAVLEATPGTEATPKLLDLPEEKREIVCARSAATTQELMDAMARIAIDVQAVTGDLAKTVSGNQGSLREIVENLARITRQVDDVVSEHSGTLSQILENTRDLTGDLSEITGRDKDRVHTIARNIEELTGQLRVVVASVQQILDPQGAGGGAGPPGPPGAAATPGGAGTPGEAGTPGAAGAPGEAGATALTPEQRERAQAGVRQAVDRLNGSLAKLDTMLDKVNEGKSPAGKLLVDERLGRKMGNAVEGLSDYVDRLVKLQIQLALRSEWLLNQTVSEGRPGAKLYFSARLMPRPDKYYLVELVSDPRGVNTVTTETITTRPPGSNVESTTLVTRTLNEEKLTFSLELAKRYGPVTFRAGIIEGSGGVGSDLHLMNDALQFSVNMYQFNRPGRSVYPRAKIWANYHFFQHLYVTTGVDDFLNQWETGNYPGGRSFNIGTDVFFGGGVYFTDDDLKSLLGAGLGSAASAVP